jgi:hypothetical protein
MAATVTFLAVTAFFWPPFWASNDDVGMSLVAGGRGPATEPWVSLIYSNVIYGWLISRSPDLFGLSAYDLWAYSLNFVALTVIAYSISVTSGRPLLALTAALLIGLRPLIFPQFTILAGFLSIAGFMLLLVYRQERRVWLLPAAATLLAFSVLVRREMLLATLPLAAVALYGRGMLRDTNIRRTLLAVLFFGIACSTIDRLYYSAPQWGQYRAGMLVREFFSDLGAATKVMAREDLLQQFHFTRNDISLLEAWFYVDPKLLDVAPLEKMLSQLDKGHWAVANLRLVGSELSAIVGPGLLYVSIAIVCAFLITRVRGRMILGCLYVLAWICLVSIVGRVGTTHAHYPLICFVFCISLVEVDLRPVASLALFVLVPLIGWSAIDNMNKHDRWVLASRQVKQDLSKVDLTGRQLIWANAFPLQLADPLFTPVATLNRLRWYSFGGFTGAPFMSEAWGDGYTSVVQRLVSGSEVPIFASDKHLGLLETWCKEHHGGQLKISNVLHLPSFSHYTVACG